MWDRRMMHPISEISDQPATIPALEEVVNKTEKSTPRTVFGFVKNSYPSEKTLAYFGRITSQIVAFLNGIGSSIGHTEDSTVNQPANNKTTDALSGLFNSGRSRKASAVYSPQLVSDENGVSRPYSRFIHTARRHLFGAVSYHNLDSA